MAQIFAVVIDSTGLRLLKAEEQTHQRALPGAGFAHDSEILAGFHLQFQPVQHRPRAFGIAEGDLVEGDRAAELAGIPAGGRDLGDLIQNRLEQMEDGSDSGHLGAERAQLENGSRAHAVGGKEIDEEVVAQPRLQRPQEEERQAENRRGRHQRVLNPDERRRMELGIRLQPIGLHKPGQRPVFGAGGFHLADASECIQGPSVCGHLPLDAVHGVAHLADDAENLEHKLGQKHRESRGNHRRRRSLKFKDIHKREQRRQARLKEERAEHRAERIHQRQTAIDVGSLIDSEEIHRQVKHARKQRALEKQRHFLAHPRHGPGLHHRKEVAGDGAAEQEDQQRKDHLLMSRRDDKRHHPLAGDRVKDSKQGHGQR